MNQPGSAEPVPVAGLRTAFTRIAATRMAGLPISNAHLAVATVGFVPWEGCHVGVLITPWAINLAAVSERPETLRLATDRRRAWRFPSGEYDLMGGDEPECGAFQFCSLFSPVLEFPDQAAAEAMAAEIMQALMTSGAADGRETARLAGASVLQAPLSRRGFLRGALGGGTGIDTGADHDRNSP